MQVRHGCVVGWGVTPLSRKRNGGALSSVVFVRDVQVSPRMTSPSHKTQGLVMRWSLLHRVEVSVPLIVAVLSRPTFAQGWIVPRPCGVGIMPMEGRPTVAPPPIRDCRQNIARTRSDVRVELADRVLRY